MKSIQAQIPMEDLRERVVRLERRQKAILAGGLMVVAVLTLAAWRSQQSNQEDIKARSISVVDKNGTVRLALGAPVPDPLVYGKKVERRSPATGITFHDAAGNERGGMGMLDDGSLNMCFDDEKTERNCLFLSPKFGNGLAINDANGNGRALLYLDPGNVSHLILLDDKGHPILS